MFVIKKIGKILSGIFTGLLAVILAVNLYTIAARYITGTPQPAVFGWSWAVIISGSMEPEILVDDLIIVHAEDAYGVGDVITYESGRSVITHRIIDQTAEGFITKGDNNNTQDLEPVPQDAVVGKVRHVIPGVGRYIEFMRSPLGMLCIVLLGVVMIELPYLRKKR